jgi:hypothetical protein
MSRVDFRAIRLASRYYVRRARGRQQLLHSFIEVKAHLESRREAWENVMVRSVYAGTKRVEKHSYTVWSTNA